jgi:hypothetical protein
MLRQAHPNNGYLQLWISGIMDTPVKRISQVRTAQKQGKH